MRTMLKRQTLFLMLAVLMVGFMSGCRSTRRGDRSKVLEAENIHLRQQGQTLEEQMRQAQAGEDDAVAREQQARADLVGAQEQAQLAAQAQEQATVAAQRLKDSQREVARIGQELDASNQRLADLQKRQVVNRRPVVASAPSRPLNGGRSPEVEAMRRDLQSQLASYGVKNLKVEIRTDRSGQDRVAIVLPDAFPAGKASLAYNASAVKAVMSVGKMIRSQYPGSQVLVEGHTDKDPIRKSKWGTNARLSSARAEAVERLLTGSGMDAAKVRVQGLGATQPIAMGNTRRAKSRNRRVEIFIAPR